MAKGTQVARVQRSGFTGRLRRKLREERISHSQFSRDTGICRASIQCYVSTAKNREPVLYNLGLMMNAYPDWDWWYLITGASERNDRKVATAKATAAILEFYPEMNVVDLAYADMGCESELNPTSLCLYNHDTDPAHDECLFCGEPLERK